MKRCAVLILLALILGLTACGSNVDANVPNDIRTQNLYRLAKVWGFVKFHHPTFLLGERCWDEELLQLLPQVWYAQNTAETDAMLLDWIMSLPEAAGYPVQYEIAYWLNIAAEDVNIQNDRNWILDETFLGATLRDELAKLKEPRVLPGENAPHGFSYGFIEFSNLLSHRGADFADPNYRLLGLFRIWNVFFYFFPYSDIMDYTWEDLLIEFIPKMLEGNNSLSYHLTLIQLGARTNDAHIRFTNWQSILERFGGFLVPVALSRAEGHFVVSRVPGLSSQLQVGDVILQVDGVDIEALIAERSRYFAVPNEEKVARLGNLILRGHRAQISVTVLRNGDVHTFTEIGIREMIPGERLESHQLLTGNIGLINPGFLPSADSLSEIMEEFADTNGLIIDLRQYPSFLVVAYGLPLLIMEYPRPAVTFSIPNQVIPGSFFYDRMTSPAFAPGDWTNPNPYFYSNPIVLLIDETSMSYPEFATMKLRVAPNVTVIGTNSIGSNGDVVFVPLPGGNTMGYTGVGIFTPEGGQTQRIGLSPDIHVERTIQGITEGRDELIEAAITYIQSKS